MDYFRGTLNYQLLEGRGSCIVYLDIYFLAECLAQRSGGWGALVTQRGEHNSKPANAQAHRKLSLFKEVIQPEKEKLNWLKSWKQYLDCKTTLEIRKNKGIQ